MLGPPARHLPGSSGWCGTAVYTLNITIFLYLFCFSHHQKLCQPLRSRMGAGWCLSLLMQSKSFGHSWFFQCFEDLFLWQRLAVIFVLEAAEILAGMALGAGGKGAAEHPCVKSSTSSCPWHLLPWGQQLPIKVCGFCFPQCKFVLQNKGGRKENAAFWFFIPFYMKVEGVVSLGTHSGEDGPQAAHERVQRSFIPLIFFFLF